MLKKGINPISATCPVILAILIGPPNCELSPDPPIIEPRYFNEEMHRNNPIFQTNIIPVMKTNAVIKSDYGM